MPDDEGLDSDRENVDPVDREAAKIDARSEDAPEVIEELVEHARDLGRDAPGMGGTPDRSSIRPTLGQAATWLIFPAVWLVYTMVRGPMADWYPYPFLNPDEHSTPEIVATCLVIMIAFVLVGLIVRVGSGQRDEPALDTAVGGA